MAVKLQVVRLHIGDETAHLKTASFMAGPESARSRISDARNCL